MDENVRTDAEQVIDPAAEPTPEPHAEPKTQTFSLEDVQKLIQSEADKRVTQALQKQKKEYEKKLSLSGLDEQQRQIAERDQTIADLQEQLRAANAAQARADLVQALAARNLPTAFADMIDVGDDPAEAQKRVDTLDKAFRAAVEDAVKQRLSGSAPGRGASKPQMTKEEFAKLSIHDMQKMAHENPELYKSMTNP